MGVGGNAMSFLIDAIIDLYILVVVLRFLMQAFRADYYNPLAQFVVKVTNPPLKPLRRIVPGLAGYDLAALFLAYALMIAKVLLLTAIAGRGIPLSAIVAWFALVELIDLFFNIFIFAIFIQALLSWVAAGSYNPAYALLDAITAPILGPIRKLIPPISGFDLSPMVGILGLYFLKLLIVPSLQQLF